MGEPNFLNRTLFHGDNLPFLRGLNSESVHLIATDPPFNKGRDFHATPDSLAAGAKFQDRWSWDDDVEGEWVDQITDDWPKVMNVINGSRESYGDDMGAFLCFMAVRLMRCAACCATTAASTSTATQRRVTISRLLWMPSSANQTFAARLFGSARQPIRRQSDGPTLTTSCSSTRKETRISGIRCIRTLTRIMSVRITFTKMIAAVTEPQTLPGPGFHRGHLAESGKASIQQIWGGTGVMCRRSSTKWTRKGLIYWPAKRNGWPAKKVYWADTQRGRPVHSMWLDIPPINSQAKERLGYPTQKPLALYERIISASSNEGDIVLDPFAGCATTPVAAERLGRQWVGMDIWDKAHETVIGRLEKEGLAGPDGKTDRLLTFGQVHYVTAPPERTDEAEEAVPFLQVTERYKEPAGPKMSRQEMFEHLIRQYGQRCQGCDRAFDDPRYLQLDHNTPRADGGINHITNRVLLCGPCNMLKSNIYTLSGLRRENGKRGYMARG